MILTGKVKTHINNPKALLRTAFVQNLLILYLIKKKSHRGQTLSFSTGHCTSEYLKKLVCSYENKNINLNKSRVWCKRDAQDNNCCTGFSFQRGDKALEQGNIDVEDDGKSFTISVKTLTQGDGVYWCGLMAEDKIIVKLAEDYFTNCKTKYYFSISL